MTRDRTRTHHGLPPVPGRRPGALAVLALALLLQVPAGAEQPGGENRPAPAQAQATPAKAPSTLASLLAAVNAAARDVAAGRRIRLAVIPIQGTESSRYRDLGFGAFLTEKLSSSMVSASGPVRLFERARLDAVLKEQALSAGGLFDDSEARKLGELAPIDDLLTGSFTRLERSLVVNLRFIDVVTGEVRGDLSETLDLTPDLAALFEDLQGRPAQAALAPRPAGTPDPPCRPETVQAAQTVKGLMADLSTPAKLARLVDAATALPFTLPCGAIHFEVLNLFTRYKLDPAPYRTFLLATLRGIQAPGDDDRAFSIVHYLMAPGQLDDPAWDATLDVASRSRRFPSFLPMLLADKLDTPASRQRLQARFGRILEQVEHKQIGRPLPVEPDTTFLDMLDALSSNFLGYSGRDVRPLVASYQAYGRRHAQAPGKRLLTLLVRMYQDAGPGEDRNRILGWICGAVNQVPASRDLQDVLVDFLVKLYEPPSRGQKADPGAAADLQRVFRLSGRRIAETLPFILGRDYRLELTGYCLQFGVKAPGLVPDLDTLIQQLSAAEDSDRQDAVRLLAHLGPAALPAEPAVLKRLRRSAGEDPWGDHSPALRRGLLGLLGSMRSANPEAHRLLIRALDEQDSWLADEAVRSLVQIGEPAARALEAEFPRLDAPYKQLRVLKVFQQRGPAAAAHLPWMKTVQATATSPLVKAAAEDVIAAMQDGA